MQCKLKMQTYVNEQSKYCSIHFDGRLNSQEEGKINRGGEYQIYVIECGEKNQYFSLVCSTSENAIFTGQDEIYLLSKKVNFHFYPKLNGNTDSKT